MKLYRQRRNPSYQREAVRKQAGSVLLVLLFFMVVMIIALGMAVPKIAQQIKRDRETEMIHRGEQYARAVKRYYKKNGRYPSRIEDLEKANNLRFLRKRYKDPMSPDGNWRLVRYGEVQLGQGAGGGLGSVPSQPAGGPAATNTDTGTNGGSSGSSFGSGNSGTGLFGSSGSGSSGSGSSLFGPSTSGTGDATNPSTSPGGTSQAGVGGASSSFGGASAGQTFGGGPFLGVASASEKQGIHEFNNKKQYKQWLFVYDPSQDRGQLIKGPYNPKAFFGQFGGQGQPGQPGQPITPAGPGFGPTGGGTGNPPPQNPPNNR